MLFPPLEFLSPLPTLFSEVLINAPKTSLVCACLTGALITGDAHVVEAMLSSNVWGVKVDTGVLCRVLCQEAAPK